MTITYLSDDELPLGVEAWNKVGVDKVRPLLVVRGLELDPAVVVGQDVGEPAHGGRQVSAGSSTTVHELTARIMTGQFFKPIDFRISFF